jgi:hypothetical protein
MSQELTCLYSVRKVIIQTVFCPESAHSNSTFTSKFFKVNVNVSLSLIKNMTVNRQGDVGVQLQEFLNLTLGGGFVRFTL